MENENQLPLLTVLVEKNKQALRKAELISVFALVLGFILHLLKLEGMDLVLIIGSVATAVIYFLNSYALEDLSDLETDGILNSAGFILFMYKLTFLSLAMASVCLLKLVINLPFARTIMDVGGLTLVITFTISLITKINDRSKIYNTVFYLRVVSALLVLVYLSGILNHWFSSIS
jgi:hypothetical protein